MYDGIAILKKKKITQDKFGNEIESYEDNPVYVKPKSIYANEFYQAATAGLKPSIKLVMKNCIDYQGEELLEYNEKLYSVIRTFQEKDGLELICQEKIGNGS